MYAWRIWAEGRASLEELESSWSVDDVQNANEILDMMDAQRRARQSTGGDRQ